LLQEEVVDGKFFPSWQSAAYVDPHTISSGADIFDNQVKTIPSHLTGDWRGVEAARAQSDISKSQHYAIFAMLPQQGKV
jgi:hypothetical protein